MLRFAIRVLKSFDASYKNFILSNTLDFLVPFNKDIYFLKQNKKNMELISR